VSTGKSNLFGVLCHTGFSAERIIGKDATFKKVKK
jgi:hypothetical protein